MAKHWDNFSKHVCRTGIKNSSNAPLPTLEMEKMNLHCKLRVAIIFYYVPHFFKFSAILFIGDPIINDQIPSIHLEACITRASHKELKAHKTNSYKKTSTSLLLFDKTRGC